MVQINAWHAGEVAYLLDALKAVPEGDGTIMGLPDITSFGTLDDGSGPLAGLV